MASAAGEPPPTPGPLAAGQDRDALVAEVRRVLTVLPPRAAALVAVSGGPDSAALAFLAAEARPDLALTLGHVRHGLRDDTLDVAAVTQQAAFLGLEVAMAEVDVTVDGQGPEAAARSQRYAALRRLARQAGAGWVMVGHTADDQAETLLLRLARGTGVPGLAGMAAVRGDVVRPLLRLRRADVHRFVVGEGLPTAADPTNADRRLRRNLARHDALPVLAGLGADVVGALSRLADLAREDARQLDADAAATAARLLTGYGPVQALPLADTLAQPAAIARRLARRLVQQVRGGDPPTAAEVVRLLALPPGSGLDLPELRATSGGGWLALAPVDVLAAEPTPLVAPGTTRWPAADLSLVATVEGQAGHRPDEDQLVLALDGPWQPPDVRVSARCIPPGGTREAGQLVLGDLGGRPEDRGDLVVRPRQPGDRLRTAGGTRKVQDVLVDAGVPRLMRDLVPLVVLGDRVLWIAGVRADDEAAAAGRVRPRLHLALAPMSAAGSSPPREQG